jgi:hypothetical protein
MTGSCRRSGASSPGTSRRRYRRGAWHDARSPVSTIADRGCERRTPPRRPGSSGTPGACDWAASAASCQATRRSRHRHRSSRTGRRRLERDRLPLSRRVLVAVGRGDDAGHATESVRPWLTRSVRMLLEEVSQIVIPLSNLPTNVPFTAAFRRGCCFVAPCRCALPIYCRVPSIGHPPTLWFARRSKTSVPRTR